jgi:endonuclease/exonuclease/phosphatase family metal-dependent hydrolase
MKALLSSLLFLYSVSAIALPEDPLSTSGNLRILSYNIKMLPRFIKREHHFPIRRARIIPAYLEQENADIVILQEAFDMKANHILRKRLRAMYPYIIGPVNQKPGFKINGGIVICSKYPMKQVGSIQYSVCESFDCWARKGVLLVEVNDGKHVYQVAGTHLNGGGSLEFKTTEYREMGQLVKQYARAGVPQFCVGDYNTSNFDTSYYRSMVKQLDAEDGPISGNLFCTNDHLNNDMETPSFERNLIDYILYRPNGIEPKDMKRSIHQYCYRWNKDHEDLSDHYALVMELKW